VAKKNQSKNNELHTISLFVANKPGVLVRAALVFARRGFNIDSLVVSPSVNPRFSRMTITAKGDLGTLDQIIKQTNKLVDVVHCSEHTPKEALSQELALFKVRVKPSTKKTITKQMRKLHARALDETDQSLIIELSGNTDELDKFEKFLKKYGIVEMVRSGKLVMTRGKEPT